MLFKRLQRFPQDERIAVVDTLENIPRCGRAFSRVNGVLCPYAPFSEAEERDVVGFMSHIMGKYGVREVYDDTPERHYRHTYGFDVPPPLKRALSELQDVFERSTGRKGRAIMRVNSSHPKKPHQHETTLTSTLTGSGTIGYKMDGTSYQIPNKHLFIFDREIPHMAAQDFSQEHPKLTIIVG